MKRALIVFMLSLSILLGASVNSGVRHETALSLSAQAEAYYVGEYSVEALSALAGSASARSDEAWNSALCTALHTLMTESCGALPSYNEILSLFRNSDANAGSESPLRFYCDDFGSCNQEQVWADAHGTFYHDGAGRDLHHLRPADPQANFTRGSQCFGTVRERFGHVETWPGTGEPVFWIAPDWKDGRGLVEVRDEIKGDVARILLYVYTVYGETDGGNLNLWTDLSETGNGLETSDGLRVIEDADTLLEWMTLDPVDSWELGRNDVVQSIQGNRNAFIDYPELAFLLFDREIPDMPSPSGWAHSCFCTLSAAADPPEGGRVTVTGLEAEALPNPGWTVERWTLSPEGAASVTQSGNRFKLSFLREDCCLTVRFRLTDPCVNGHSWDAGIVAVQPGCTEEGTRTYTCTVCGAERTEAVPALGHDWHSTAVAPTCVQAGLTVESCWRCGLEIVTPVTPALGHAWDAGTVTRPPTKTQPGERLYRCTRCDAVRTEEIPFRFVDVQKESLWYFTPVYWALHYDPPITSGIDDTHFGPRLPCTRCQVVTFLWRAAHSPQPSLTESPFSDVAPDAWYYSPVLWALERQITAGTSATEFSPNKPCTRAQIVTFLWVTAGRPEPESGDMPFGDVAPGVYYYKPVLWAVEQGITAGTAPDTFSPNRSCTRAEVVTMLFQTAESTKKAAASHTRRAAAFLG
ncbi:MAG: S-layer homology domain-containing protein [Oscillospiraceae bacterium]|nr:S-layer homology domain-containing protein [Oscillospiraceae bacterium]